MSELKAIMKLVKKNIRREIGQMKWGKVFSRQGKKIEKVQNFIITKRMTHSKNKNKIDQIAVIIQKITPKEEPLRMILQVVTEEKDYLK